jgi:O-antigen ligase
LLPNYGLNLVNIYGSADLSLVEIGVLAGLFSWLFKSFKENELQLNFGSGLPWLVILYFWIVFSLFWCPDTGRGIQQAMKVAVGLLIYFLQLNIISNKKEFRSALLIWLVIALIMSCIGTYEMLTEGITAAQQYTIPDDAYIKIHRDVRTTGFFRGADMMGFLISLGIIMALMVFNSARGFWLYLAVISIPLQFINLFATMSRKSILAVLLAVVYYFWSSRRIKRLILISIGLAACILILLSSQEFLSALLLRLKSFTMDPQVAMENRLETWKIAFSIFRKSPLFGSGIGSFPLLSAAQGSPLSFPHNFYIYLLCETGLIGFFIFGGWAVNLILVYHKFISQQSDNLTVYIAKGFVAIFLIIFVQGVFRSFSLSDPFFWAAFGLSNAFLNIYQSENEQED